MPFEKNTDTATKLCEGCRRLWDAAYVGERDKLCPRCYAKAFKRRHEGGAR